MSKTDAERLDRLEREMRAAKAVALLAVAASMHRPRKKSFGDRLWGLL